MYVCLCRGLTEADVRQVGRVGVIAPDDLIQVLELDDPESCGRCIGDMEGFVDLAVEGAREREPLSVLLESRQATDSLRARQHISA